MESIRNVITEKMSKFGKLKGKITGFTMIANWFIEKDGFSIYEKMVVIVIKKHQMNKQEAWPSLEKIALQSGCSISSVKKAIHKLEQKNILIKERSQGRKVNVYTIRLERF